MFISTPPICAETMWVQGFIWHTFGVAFNNEHRAGHRWFLRARAHHLRGPFWWGGWGSPAGPIYRCSLLKTKLKVPTVPYDTG